MTNKVINNIKVGEQTYTLGGGTSDSSNYIKKPSNVLKVKPSIHQKITITTGDNLVFGQSFIPGYDSIINTITNEGATDIVVGDAFTTINSSGAQVPIIVSIEVDKGYNVSELYCSNGYTTQNLTQLGLLKQDSSNSNLYSCNVYVANSTELTFYCDPAEAVSSTKYNLDGANIVGSNFDITECDRPNTKFEYDSDGLLKVKQFLFTSKTNQLVVPMSGDYNNIDNPDINNIFNKSTDLKVKFQLLPIAKLLGNSDVKDFTGFDTSGFNQLFEMMISYLSDDYVGYVVDTTRSFDTSQVSIDSNTTFDQFDFASIVISGNLTKDQLALVDNIKSYKTYPTLGLQYYENPIGGTLTQKDLYISSTNYPTWYFQIGTMAQNYVKWTLALTTWQPKSDAQSNVLVSDPEILQFFKTFWAAGFGKCDSKSLTESSTSCSATGSDIMLVTNMRIEVLDE